jgi:uncharacterized membrane protein
MGDRWRFFLSRLSERLWVKPLVVCLLSVAGALLAHLADDSGLDKIVPDIKTDSLETLLKVISSSMLVIATFAVGSMVSAFASASSTATPRSFSLVVADDVSQNALSTFIGAFIYGIVALIALQNGYYGKAGRFAIFVLTLLVFAIVILTFVRWVDRVARLGRLGSTVDKVETATTAAMKRRRRLPTLRGARVTPPRAGRVAIYADAVGYVQRVDIAALQKCAQAWGARIVVDALPGAFCAPGDPLAYMSIDAGEWADPDPAHVMRAFTIGDDRTFEDDPRFGLIVLSEISSRALSPAVNDPGTAIDVIGTFVRLFALWSEPVDEADQCIGECDRIEVPELSLRDLFDDAFRATARDGAGTLEVAVRLQKALASLAATGDSTMRDAALHHAREALARAELAMDLPADIDAVRAATQFTQAA